MTTWTESERLLNVVFLARRCLYILCLNERTKTPNRGPVNDAIMIEGTSSYAEILKSVKDGVSPEEMGVEIKKVHKNAIRCTEVSCQGDNHRRKAETISRKLTRCCQQTQIFAQPCRRRGLSSRTLRMTWVKKKWGYLGISAGYWSRICKIDAFSKSSKRKQIYYRFPPFRGRARKPSRWGGWSWAGHTVPSRKDWPSILH